MLQDGDAALAEGNSAQAAAAFGQVLAIRPAQRAQLDPTEQPGHRCARARGARSERSFDRWCRRARALHPTSVGTQAGPLSRPRPARRPRGYALGIHYCSGRQCATHHSPEPAMTKPQSMPASPPSSAGAVIRPQLFRPPPRGSALPRVEIAWLPLMVSIALTLWALAAWFVFTARSVTLVTAPAGATVHVAEWLAPRIGQHWLLRPGQHRVFASAPGYWPRWRSIQHIGESEVGSILGWHSLTVLWYCRNIL